MPQPDLPISDVPSRRLSEEEVVALGLSVGRLRRYSEGLSQLNGSGGVTIGTRSGSSSFALTMEDQQAVLALLIEREVAYLASYDIALDPIPNL